MVWQNENKLLVIMKMTIIMVHLATIDNNDNSSLQTHLILSRVPLESKILGDCIINLSRIEMVAL